MAGPLDMLRVRPPNRVAEAVGLKRTAPLSLGTHVPERLTFSAPREPSVRSAVLRGDQFGDLRRDLRHRLFASVQPGSRGEQEADLLKLFIGRSMNNRDEPFTP